MLVSLNTLPYSLQICFFFFVFYSAAYFSRFYQRFERFSSSSLIFFYLTDLCDLRGILLFILETTSAICDCFLFESFSFSRLMRFNCLSLSFITWDVFLAELFWMRPDLGTLGAGLLYLICTETCEYAFSFTSFWWPITESVPAFFSVSERMLWFF